MDTNLNDDGRLQANMFYNAYKNVPFNKIYISELRRTQQSIQQFIDADIPYEKLSGLDELAWGIHEGQPSTPQTKSAFMKLMRDWTSGNLDAKFDKGESPNEVLQRQKEALKVIMSKPEEENVLICMHGRAMRLFLCLLTDKPLTKMEEFPHQNLVLYKVTYDGNMFEIADFNNAIHLQIH